MRYCMILILFVCLCFVSYYNFKITTIEREIYFLYSNNFMDFFVVDNDSNDNITDEEFVESADFHYKSIEDYMHDFNHRQFICPDTNNYYMRILKKVVDLRL